MVPRNKSHFENLVTAIAIGVVLCAFLCLTIFLFLSPTL